MEANPSWHCSSHGGTGNSAFGNPVFRTDQTFPERLKINKSDKMNSSPAETRADLEEGQCWTWCSGQLVQKRDSAHSTWPWCLPNIQRLSGGARGCVWVQHAHLGGGCQRMVLVLLLPDKTVLKRRNTHRSFGRSQLSRILCIFPDHMHRERPFPPSLIPSLLSPVPLICPSSSLPSQPFSLLPFPPSHTLSLIPFPLTHPFPPSPAPFPSNSLFPPLPIPFPSNSPLSCLTPTCPPKSNLLVACFLESFKHRVLVASLQKDYDCMRMQYSC